MLCLEALLLILLCVSWQMWMSALKATADVSRYASTWWAAMSAAAERAFSWVTTSIPVSKGQKVTHTQTCCSMWNDVYYHMWWHLVLNANLTLFLDVVKPLCDTRWWWIWGVFNHEKGISPDRSKWKRVSQSLKGEEEEGINLFLLFTHPFKLSQSSAWQLFKVSVVWEWLTGGLWAQKTIKGIAWGWHTSCL